MISEIDIKHMLENMDPRAEEPQMTPLESAEYEFATIEYDYNIHQNAAERILAIFRRLAKE